MADQPTLTGAEREAAELFARLENAHELLIEDNERSAAAVMAHPDFYTDALVRAQYFRDGAAKAKRALAILRGAFAAHAEQARDREDAERWRWIRQFLHAEDSDDCAGQFLFFDDAMISESITLDGFDNTVDALADAARSVSLSTETTDGE